MWSRVRCTIVAQQLSSHLLLYARAPSIRLVRWRTSGTGQGKSNTGKDHFLTGNVQVPRQSHNIGSSKAVAETKDEEATRSREELNKKIAEVYDESLETWEDLWGDHMHHGYYDPSKPAHITQHRAAQIRMMDEALKFAGLEDDLRKKPKAIVDVGCGIGGCAMYLVKKYGATCKGFTLSPRQVERAQALAIAKGLADKALFQVGDALDQPFADGQFDLVWAMMSAEHMPNKKKFVAELARVAAPGATIIIVTWCHRDLSNSEKSLRPDEQQLLRKICDDFYLPAWCSAADYVQMLQSLSLQDIKTEDWSQYVAPFWPAVMRSMLTWKGMTSIIRGGWKTMKAALAMRLMVQGYHKGLTKFTIITCRKSK